MKGYLYWRVAMTVISTLITPDFTVHASDSILAQRKPDGKNKIIETKQSKILHVKKWRGAISYWGLAKCDDYKWNTFNWLKQQAENANNYSSAEKFAQNLAIELNGKLDKMRFPRETDRGIGLHFSVYENINGDWIPELFLISNFKDTNYDSLYSDGIKLTRQTYSTLFKEEPSAKHFQSKFRHEMFEKLKQENGFLSFNNGDPHMYNVVAKSIHDCLRIHSQRKDLKNDAIDLFVSIAALPIVLMSNIQKNLFKDGYQRVGGKIHHLVIKPNGEYESKTGD